MRHLITSIVCCATAFVGTGSVRAAIDYHFVPAMNGQPVGFAQGVQIAPEKGPANFLVTIQGAMTGSNPGNSPQQAHAYLDKWGLGVLNPAVGADKGIAGQIEMDARNGGEYIRMEFPTEVRLTYLTFASVGFTDKIRIEADGQAVDLNALFPDQPTVRTVSRAQGTWPGHLNFTQASEALAFAKTWDIFVTAGDGVQLENVGVEVPEPATLVLWCLGLGAAGIFAVRRRLRVASCATA